MKAEKTSWTPNNLDLQLIDLAFIEDLGWPYRDITTSLLFPDAGKFSKARIISKNPEPIIICGLPMVEAVLMKLDPHCEIQTHYQDGEILAPETTLLTLVGPASSLLMAERIMLNFLQHLCAVATFTAKFVSAISHTKAKILDTRKTLPGFRSLEKYAVHCGGGVNHRMGLYDAILIKDTHIDVLGGISPTLDKLPHHLKKDFPTIIEIRTEHELEIVLNKGLSKINRVLLDNMSPKIMKKCTALCKDIIATEASGNISLENVVSVAECGVDYISIGKLTHSAGNIDLSMKSEL